MTEDMKTHIRHVTKTIGGWIVLRVWVDPKVLKRVVFENKNVSFNEMRRKLKNKSVYIGINPIRVQGAEKGEPTKKLSLGQKLKLRKKIKELKKVA